MTSEFFSLRLLKRRIIELFNYCFKGKSKINVIIDALIIILFGFAFFSIPACSFTGSLRYITWGLTICTAGLMITSTFLFYSFKINVISISFVLFIISSLISSALNGFVNFIFTPILLVLFSLITYQYVLGNKASKHLIIYSAFIGTILFLGLFTIKYKNELLSLNFVRLGSDFGDENDIAIILAFGTAISFYTLFKEKNIIVKILSSILFLLFGFCGFSSGSKIYVIILLVSCILTIFIHFGLKKWWISLIIVGCCTALFFVVINLPSLSFLKSRFDDLFAFIFSSDQSEKYKDGSSVSRLNMFFCGSEMFLRKPLFGYGIWGFANFSNMYGGWSHNNFSETLCNFGLVGTLFFHFGYIYAIYGYFKSKNKRNLQMEILLLVFFFCMMFSVALNSQKIYAYLVGVVIASSREPSLNFEFNYQCIKKYIQNRKSQKNCELEKNN